MISLVLLACTTLGVDEMNISGTPETVLRFLDGTQRLTNAATDETFGGGNFGHWLFDADGLPAYEYTMDQVADPRAQYETTRGVSRDHWHLLGNDRITATAHNTGYVQLYDWTRGGKVLNRWEPEQKRFAGGFKFVESDGAIWNTLWDYLPQDATQRRVFGAGYFEKETHHAGLVVTERITAPPGDDPVLVSETTLRNVSKIPKDVTVVEFWDVDAHQLTMAPFMVWPFPDFREWLKFLFQVHPSWNPSAGILKARIECSIPFFVPKKDTRALCDFHPKTVFLAALDALPAGYTQYAVDAGRFFGADGIGDPPGVKGGADGCLFASRSLHAGTSILAFRRSAHLLPNGEVRFRYLHGYDEESSIPHLAEKYRTPPDLEARPSVEFAAPEASWLGRELAWHAYNLQAGSIYSDFYGTHVVDQGSAYAYEQGLSGATRDFALFVLALTYVRPDLAKETLRFMARTQDPRSGEFPYALVGHGVKTGLVIHSKSSDLDLFFLWALAEYLGATQDLGFLNEEQPYYPPSKSRAVPLLEHARAAFRHLVQDVGIGPHGLIHSGTGDWNDGLMALSGRPLATVFRGESAQNAGLAMFVLPLLAGVLDEMDPPFAHEIRRFAEKQAQALKPLWTGKWMARGYSGRGNELFGTDRLFLDAQAFAVLGNVWTQAQRQVLFANVDSLCVQPQQAGALCIAPTNNNPVDPGTTWAAVDSWTVHAWATVDPKAAWDFFLRTTLAIRAEAHPDAWCGIWSGPDAHNADTHGSPGQSFTGPLTPTRNFPVMNMNRHAGVLFDAVKLAGIEPRNGIITIDPRVPLDWFAIRFPLIGVAYTATRHFGYYNPVATGTFRFAVRVPSELNSSEAGVFSNGTRVQSSATQEGRLFFEMEGRPGGRLEWEIRRAP